MGSRWRAVHPVRNPSATEVRQRKVGWARGARARGSSGRADHRRAASRAVLSREQSLPPQIRHFKAAQPPELVDRECRPCASARVRPRATQGRSGPVDATGVRGSARGTSYGGAPAPGPAESAVMSASCAARARLGATRSAFAPTPPQKNCPLPSGLAAHPIWRTAPQARPSPRPPAPAARPRTRWAKGHCAAARASCVLSVRHPPSCDCVAIACMHSKAAAATHPCQRLMVKTVPPTILP